MKEILHAMYKFTMKKLIMAGHYSKRLLHLTTGRRLLDKDNKYYVNMLFIYFL